MRRRQAPRRGVTIIESAVVYPVYMLLVIIVVIGALGVFRYQELASLAREAARHASVRGYSYALGTGNAAVTEADVYNNVIKPKALLLDLQKLTYKVTWAPDNRQGSMVTVTVSYNWVPEAYFAPITLSSTSAMPVTY